MKQVRAHTAKAHLANWHRQKMLIDSSIQVQHLVGFPDSFFSGGKCMMALLPQELP